MFIAFLVLLLVCLSSTAHSENNAMYLISWNRITDPTVNRVLIYRSVPDDASVFHVLDSVSVSTTGYVDKNIETGKRYYYKLRARNYVGTLSPFSRTVSGISLDSSCDVSLRDLCKIAVATKVDSVTFNFEWSTKQETTGKLRYWLDGDQNFRETNESTNYSMVHTETITNLEMDEKYVVCALSHDADGNLIISEPVTISTARDTTDDGSGDGDDGTQDDGDGSGGSLSTGVSTIYPIPYIPDEGNLTIKNIPSEGTVTVYDLRGRKVWVKSWSGTTEISWNGLNGRGTVVSSGRYFFVIKGPGGSIYDKRAIIVVR